MIPRKLPRLAIAVLFATQLASIYLCASVGEAKRPNILFILTDDQSPFDFNVYNPRSMLETPAIDQIAAEGMVITGAYHMGSWSGAVCTPSRHMIMSGRSVWHVPDQRPPGKSPHAGNPDLIPRDLAEQTLPAVFNRAGYDTMRTCKQGNSYPAANALFTVSHIAKKREGTEEEGSAWHAERVLEYLAHREETKDEDPFLIYLGFSHPHDPRYGKPELLRKYGATNHRDPNSLPVLDPQSAAPPLPVNYLPEHPFPHGHPGLRDEEKVEGVWNNRDEATIRNEIGREYACSENIDIQVGRVLAKLEETGELANTYVIYTSDHGIAIGRHGLTGKQNLYEHTWRVPMLIRGPGIAAGSRARGNIYLMDVLATLCDLTGVQPPATSEGKSFASVLFGKQTQVRDTLYGVYSGGTKPGMRAVRQGEWKLIKYDVLDGAVRETQLFNLRENPHEFLKQHQNPSTIELTGAAPTSQQRNLAGDARYEDKQKQLEALLLKQQIAHDDPYRLWDQP